MEGALGCTRVAPRRAPTPPQPSDLQNCGASLDVTALTRGGSVGYLYVPVPRRCVSSRGPRRVGRVRVSLWAVLADSSPPSCTPHLRRAPVACDKFFECACLGVGFGGGGVPCHRGVGVARSNDRRNGWRPAGGSETLRSSPT